MDHRQGAWQGKSRMVPLRLGSPLRPGISLQEPERQLGLYDPASGDYTHVQWPRVLPHGDREGHYAPGVPLSNAAGPAQQLMTTGEVD